MNAPDELAEVIYKARWVDGIKDVTVAADAGIANAILAAGYSKPRTITTVEELDALPYGSVVLDASSATATKLDADYWEVAGFASHFRVEAIDLPAAVLHERATK